MEDTQESNRPSVADIYREQRAMHGRMHDTFYKMPPVFASIIGALWYFAAQYVSRDRVLSTGVFLFAAVSAVVFLAAMQRYRMALRAYLRHIDHYDGTHKVTMAKTYFPRTGTALMALLGFAAIFSLIGAAYSASRSAPQTAIPSPQLTTPH